MRNFKKLMIAVSASLGFLGTGQSHGAEALNAATDESKTVVQENGPKKIGFVYVSPIGEAGYTFQHDLGRLAIEKKFGSKVQVDFAESVAEGSDAEHLIRGYAEAGYSAVFATSFGYMTPILKVSKRYPNIALEHASGYRRTANLNTYLARFYEGRYLTGLVAGKMTKSNVIGYVAAFPIPEVIRGINAFTRGIRAVNPQAEVHVVWINSWFNPEKETEAAHNLIGQGADVLTMHADSPATIEVAEKEGVYALGYNSDLSKFGPHAHLTSSVTNWAPYYIKRVTEILQGSWTGNRDTWDGLKENMIQLAPFNKIVPQAVRTFVNEAKNAIIAGTLHPFQGPVMDNKGDEQIPAGRAMTDKEMLGLNWYVEGVVGKLPH